MTDTPTTSPLDVAWEVVVITLRYLDKGQPQARTVRIVRSEVEANERKHFVAQAQATGNADALEQAEAYELKPEKFKERITTNVEGMATSPLRVKGDEPNSFRILRSWAVVDVTVTINPEVESHILKL